MTRVYAEGLNVPVRAAVLATLVSATAPASALSPEKTVPLPSKGDRWIEVRTRNFTLYGNANQSKTKEVGLEMERLRAVLVALTGATSSNAPVPTWIYVFKTHQALEPYLPHEDGKPIPASGYTFLGPDGNYISLSAAWNSDPRPNVYHAYVYDFLRANFPPQPVWYEVGVAGYYSTFRTEGNEAHTGKIREDDLDLLRESMLLPLDRHFAVDRDDPEYTDRFKRRLFYAESWALVHYLIHSQPDRKAQLGRFLTLMKQGRPQDEAFREAFGIDYATMYGELVAYIRSRRYFFNRLQFAELKPPTEARVTPMSYDAVLVRLGDLLCHGRMDELPDAERYYQAVMASDPSNAGALAGMGFVRKEQNRTDEASALMRRSIEAGSTDFRVYYADGEARWDALTETPYSRENLDPKARDELDTARAALRRSAELNPDFAEALALLGRTYRMEPRGANVDEGIAALETAKKRLPSREGVAIDLAALYEQKGDKARGETVLAETAGPKAAVALTKHKAAGEFDESVAEINRLVAAAKFDEALAKLDSLMQEAGGETRARMEEYREDLRKTAALNRAAADYNAAIALYNKRDYSAALAAFQKVAAESPDPDITAAAKQKAAEISRILPKKAAKP